MGETIWKNLLILRLHEEICGRPIDESEERVKAIKLFRENIKLVGYVCKKIGTPRDPAYSDEDKYQLGYEALWRVCQMYDPSKNIKFATYAVPWIKGYIMTQINQCGQRIRVPRSNRDISGILYKMGYEVPLTIYEMDEVLEKYPNISREQLLSYTDITVISADAPIQSVDDDNLSIIDNIADTNSMADFDAIELDDIEEIIDMILLYI